MTASNAPVLRNVQTLAVDRSGWGHPVRLFQPHNPAFYLYWIMIAHGAWVFYHIVAANTVYPTAITIALTVEALYCLPWIWFLTRRDRYEREPAKLAVLGFFWGGLVAPWVMALPGNGAILSLMVKLVSLDFHNTWGPALTAPVVEESAKYVGLALLALLARNHVRSAYDGFLLGAFVGLGFQVFENVLYVIQAVNANFGSQEVRDTVQILVVRSLAGFWSHTLFSAIAGTGLGYFLGATDRSMFHRLGVAAGLFVLAMVSHGLWDAAVASPLFALAGIVTGTVAIILVWRLADRRQREWIRELLADDRAAGTVTQDELDIVAGTPRARRVHLKAIRKAEGRARARQVGHVLHAQIDLAAAIASTDDVDSDAAQHARAELLRVRALPS